MGTSSVCNHQHVGDVEERLPRHRRAVMYVPASDERKFNKAPSLGVDTVVLDCEDGVAVNQKVYGDRCGLGLTRLHVFSSSLPFFPLGTSS